MPRVRTTTHNLGEVPIGIFGTIYSKDDLEDKGERQRHLDLGDYDG